MAGGSIALPTLLLLRVLLLVVGPSASYAWVNDHKPEHWGFYDTSISFWPDQSLCTALQITIRFTPNQTIDSNDYVAVVLPGVTSGGCDGYQGATLVPTALRYYPSWQWYAWFVEGTPSDEWHDSRLYLQPRGLHYIGEGTPQLVVLDLGNQLKLSAPIYNSSVYKIHYQPACTTGITAMPVSCVDNTTSDVSTWTAVAGSAYMASDSISFFPAVLHRKLKISITFIPGLTLHGGDYIQVGLGGFTNGNDSAAGDCGRDVAVGSLPLDNNASYFKAGWTEGQFVAGRQAGFVNSSIDLYVGAGLTVLAGTQVTVVVSDIAGIRAHCGVARNSPNVTIMVNGVNNNVKKRPFKTTAPIGDGCRAQGYCNGHGTCDLCTSTCVCEEGYGAPDDIIEDHIAPDCSQKVCPIGWSFTGVPQGTTGAGMRKLRECSGGGYCRRDLGQCSCFDGYEGYNCARKACPYPESGVECSGHGQCLPMNLMSWATDGEPASAFVGSYGSSNTSTSAAYAWDGTVIYGCKCDSTWPVGLGMNETQVPEWFGPTCSMRRCPSGDDPNTSRNETDCSGVTAPGGRGVGEHGNLCYVPCSNRGVCDHISGLCQCFEGYYGTNCGKAHALAHGQAAAAISSAKR